MATKQIGRVAPVAKTVSVSGTIGKNASYVLDSSGIMTITIDLNQEQGPSASGKTTIIATSSGNKAIDGSNGAVIGLNVYRK